ncbi:uncharacterized protein LOC132720525 isoform X2 [Ruditapes philippinarum]|nr:uncharacterized protein LOC132720525 isoform X2 [Ruditapes philippinarum]XP_060560663.1 uncharacterized protein LOC132720525 isoform X2 [Ruditapes philippinarum]XP_060560664.1 uncharacterized protein LOC132720525 isoform X2 [Ruditapes philippinarum]XP_060560665.1 uncharacterized protein LOC132720525 isoform X2 [Ruditapes philippinarum]
MSDDNGDVTAKSSFGWLFPTVTAFGLLVFLAMSFAFYHRRLMLRKRKEAEYNRFFRLLRPDLEVTDKKITRARSILTNTHNPDLDFTASCAYYNEAFVRDDADNEDDYDEGDDFEDNERLQEKTYTEVAVRQNGVMVDNQNEDCDLYLRSVQARRQVLLADVHSEEMYRESDLEVFKTINSIRKDMNHDVIEEERKDGIKELSEEHTLKNRNLLQIDGRVSRMQSEDSMTISESSNRQIVANKPPVLKPITNMAIKDEIVMNKTITKSTKSKKKKLGILTRKKTGNSVPLSNGSSYASTFYSEPRRCSEPALFLYDEEAADPKDSKFYKNQNKILFNPYYTEVSMPVNKSQKQRKSSTAEDAQEVDFLQKPNLNRERSMPVADKIHKKHVPASTWM